MSSARKRAKRNKVQLEVEHLKQELMMVKNHYSVMKAFADGLVLAQGRLADQANANRKDELDDDHPLCLVNSQIEDLLEGVGASEDHEDVIKFFLDTGLPRSTVDRIHKAIVWGGQPPLTGPARTGDLPRSRTFNCQRVRS